jgi:hypothetical protein
VLASFHDGRPSLHLDAKLSPPEPFKRAAKALLGRDQGGWKLSDTMFWDGAKQTMISIERTPAVPLAEFARARQTLVAALQRLIDQHHLAEFKIDATIIATDVEHLQAGKHKGAQHILGWLQHRALAPHRFITFGDSPSDRAMAQTFGDQGTPTTFVYVGDPQSLHLTGREPYTTTITGGGYSRDTADYLRDLGR